MGLCLFCAKSWSLRAATARRSLSIIPRENGFLSSRFFPASACPTITLFPPCSTQKRSIPSSPGPCIPQARKRWLSSSLRKCSATQRQSKSDQDFFLVCLRNSSRSVLNVSSNRSRGIRSIRLPPEMCIYEISILSSACLSSVTIIPIQFTLQCADAPSRVAPDILPCPFPSTDRS